MQTRIFTFVLMICAAFFRLSSQIYSTTDSLALLAIDDSCDISDSLNWNTESNPGNWDGVIWNTDNPKRVAELSVDKKALTGEMDVSDLISLTNLNCENNQLTFLNVSAQVNLTNLYCNLNQLNSLDVSALTNLTTFECAYNQLKSLDISTLTNLYEVECAYNQLSSLNVSTLAKLAHLHCGHNQLTSLDVSELLNLNVLTCFANQLTTLDVSNLVNLYRLHCNANLLTVLDVSNLTNLTDLGCSINQLTSLDISSLTKLNYLYCSSNQLTSLDVSALINLSVLECDGNRLPFSSLATGLYVGDFIFIPQDTLFESGFVAGDTTIDYSKEALIDGTPTQFVFYKDNVELETNNTGLFSTTGTGIYHCQMTNAKFPGLTLTTAAITVTESTGIEDISTSELYFYPNPAKAIGKFTYPSGKDVSIEIYDLSGLLLRTIPDQDQNGETEVDFSDFKPGVYAYRLIDEEGKVYFGKVMRE